jgi:hypothetical protein
MNMNESEHADELNCNHWAIRLDETDMPIVPPPPIVDEPGETEQFPMFSEEIDIYPTEGHHPRLFRFGDVA